MLTVKGKQQFLRLASSQVLQFGRTIVLGIDTTPETETDTKLGFEVGRANIEVISPDFVDGSVVFKGTIPREVTGIIYEVGIWSMETDPSNGTYGSRLLVSFDSSIELWSAGTSFDTTNARIGLDALRLSLATNSTASATLEGMALDLLGYSNADEFKIAYYASTNLANVKVRFGQTTGDYYEATIPSPSSGYHVDSLTKPSFSATGNPSWSSITYVTISATSTSGGAGTVDFDGIRIEDTDTFNPDYALLSRYVLDEPMIKTTQTPMDVEYALKVNFVD